MQQYFLENSTFSKQDSHHIINVMRFKTGEKIIVVKENKRYFAELLIENKDVSYTNLVLIDSVNELKCENIIALAMIKHSNFEIALQKLTELGMTKIIPLVTQRCNIHKNENLTKKMDRWNKIVKEAAEQSHRNMIPVIVEPIKINELKGYDDFNKLYCSAKRDGTNLIDSLSDKNIVVVGPEGGLTEQENEQLKTLGFKNVKLTKTILRAETAAIAVASVISLK